jgi:hypothetical protein
VTNYERAYLQGFTEALNTGLTKSAQSITGAYYYPSYSQDMMQMTREHPKATLAVGLGAPLVAGALLTSPLWGPAVATGAAAAGPALATGATGASALAKRYGAQALNAAKTYGSAAYNATINAAKTYGPAALNATKRYGAQAINAATRVGAPVMNKVNMVRQGWNKLPWPAKYAIPPGATMGAGLGYKALDVLFGFDPLGSLDDDKRTVPTLTLSEEQRFNDQQDQDSQSEWHSRNGQNGTYNGAYKPNTNNSSRDAYGDVDFLNYGE